MNSANAFLKAQRQQRVAALASKGRIQFRSCCEGGSTQSRILSPVHSADDAATVAELLGYGDSSVTGRAAEKSIWVFVCIEIWQRMAFAPMCLFDTSDASEPLKITSGPLPTLLAKPSASITQNEYLRQCASHMAVYGIFLSVMRDMQDQPTDTAPVAIEIAHPAHMTVNRWDGDGQPTEWVLTTRRGSREIIPDSAVIRLHKQNPHVRDFCPLSPLEALRATVDLDFQMRLHNFSLVKNGGRMSLVFFHDPEKAKTVDDLRLAAEVAKKRFSGNNAGSMGHFNTVKDVKEFGVTPKDMDFLNQSAITRREIFATYQIPPVAAGDDARSTFNNGREMEKATWERTILPLSSGIMGAHNDRLLPAFRLDPMANEIRQVFAQVVPVLREDEKQSTEVTKTRVDSWKVLVDAGVSPEKAGEIVGLNIENSDIIDTNPVSDDETRRLPSMPEKRVFMDPPLILVEPEPAVDAPESDEIREASRRALWTSIIRQIDDGAGAVSSAMRKEAFRQRSQTMEILNDAAIAAVAVIVLDLLSGDGSQDQAAGNEFAERIYGQFKDGHDSSIRGALGDPLNRVAEMAAGMLAAEVGQPGEQPGAGLAGEMATISNRLGQINTTTQNRLSGALVKVIEQARQIEDPTNEQIEGLVRERTLDVFRQLEGPRRRAITTTETTTAGNAGRFGMMTDLGIDQHEWLSSRDPVVRETHMEYDGKVRTIGVSFADDTVLRYPGDPLAIAAEVVFCRCVTTAVIS